MKSALMLVLITTLAIPAVAHSEPTPLRDAASREAIRLARTGGTMGSQATQGQQRNWVARHPVLIGTLLGVGIGVPIGVATCHFPTAEGSSCSYYTYPGNARLLGGVTIGLVGAGIGAGVGALIAVSRR